jgi:hypothetical protein
MIYLRYWTSSGISGVLTGCWKIKKILGQLYVDKSNFEHLYDVTGKFNYTKYPGDGGHPRRNVLSF